MARGGIRALAGAVLTVALATAGADEVDWIGTHFAGYSGCALVLRRDRHHERSWEYGIRQCHMPLSPCSTFKIPNALIGLQTGVVEGPGTVKHWDGTVYPRAELNHDHTLASAVRDSVVWYFQDLARDVGAERMAEWLARLHYGNQDISSGIDRFWLGASLQIDAYGQLEFLKGLTHGTLPFRPEFQQEVRDMLVQPSGLGGVLHGKTGSCRGDPEAGQPDHGWFVGWLDGGPKSNPSTIWFVVNIRGDGASGGKARDMAVDILTELPHR